MTTSGSSQVRMLTPSQLDAVAGALSADVLAPFVPAARPFALGDASTFGIRTDYRAQSPTVVAPRALLTSVQTLAEHIVAALGGALITIDADFARRLAGPMGEDDVLLCVDLLHRLADPAPLLVALRRGLETAALAIVATPLRPLTFELDDRGPPSTPDTARLWTFPELQAGLDAFGIEPLFGGVLRERPDIGLIVASARTPTAGHTHLPE